MKAPAKLLGASYAHFQHGVDQLIEWGFKKLKQSSIKKDNEPAPQTRTGKALRAGKSIMGFIGDTGDAYYKTYEKLKQK